MSTQILMPALSPTMTEGKLARWLKKIGEEVRAGDVIAEIETDKATMEVEAVDEGKLARILVDEGTEGVPVNTPIAVLAANGEDVSAGAVTGAAQGSTLPNPRRRRRLRTPTPSPRALRRASAHRPRRRSRRRSRTRTGVLSNPSPCARRCAMPWRPSCGATPTCS